MMMGRRVFAAGFAVMMALGASRAAWAQDAPSASAFVQEFGSELVSVVNGEGSISEKERRLRPLIDNSVDVETIARFCLGRYAAVASPQQAAEFSRLFHAVLVNNITSKIGDYRGVTFRMGESTMRGTEAYVGTVVQRPNSAPTNVRWVISTATGKPKIVDVVAEGTSLRLTQRSDYSSYLSHNGNNIDSLLSAMRSQVGATG